MKRYILLFISLFVCMRCSTVIHADALSEVLYIYGTSEDIIDVDSFMQELEIAKTEYKRLKNEYTKDEYLMRTKEVADILQINESACTSFGNRIHKKIKKILKKRDKTSKNFDI